MYARIIFARLLPKLVDSFPTTPQLGNWLWWTPPFIALANSSVRDSGGGNTPRDSVDSLVLDDASIQRWDHPAGNLIYSRSDPLTLHWLG